VTNKDHVFEVIQSHPEGLDDDDISQLTGIAPRQQVQQLCNQLAASNRIRRQSVEKAGKRRKIHNFPGGTPAAETENWRKRLAALVAATGRTESDLLDESLQLFAMKVLADTNRGDEL
jgi:hypothetical protein